MINAELLDALPKLSTFAILAGATVAGLALYLTRRHERRKLLSEELQKFFASTAAANLAEILSASPQTLASDPVLRKSTLETLSALQRIAFQVSERPADWDRVLQYDQHQMLVDAVTACSPLIQVLRYTSLPVEIRAWNGHRAKAMAALTKALRFKVQRPR